MTWAYDPEWGEGSLDWQIHDEYGSVPVTIGDHQAWLEKMSKASPETNFHGHLMTWRLVERPTEEQWETFKRVLYSYKPEHKSWQSEPPAVKPVEVWLEEVEVKTTRTVLYEA